MKAQITIVLMATKFSRIMSNLYVCQKTDDFSCQSGMNIFTCEKCSENHLKLLHG